MAGVHEVRAEFASEYRYRLRRFEEHFGVKAKRFKYSGVETIWFFPKDSACRNYAIRVSTQEGKHPEVMFIRG